MTVAPTPWPIDPDDLVLLMLATLADEAGTARDIGSRLAERHNISPPTGDRTLRTCLQRLERGGFVRGTHAFVPETKYPARPGPLRKLYALTDAGHDEAARRAALFQSRALRLGPALTRFDTDLSDARDADGKSAYNPK